MPPGVLNIVHGDKEAVDALIQDPDIQSLSFVGSTPIAQYVYEQSTKAGKRGQALGGAKNHLFVMPDADLDQTTDALIGSAYGSASERCMAVSDAVTVGDTSADALLEKLKPRVEALKLGGYDDLSVEMGPLVTKAHLDKVTGYVDQGVANGANLLVDGRGQTPAKNPNGLFIGAACLITPKHPCLSIKMRSLVRCLA